MYRIFCIYPFGKDNFHPGWHLVLFNHWFKICNLPGWCQTSISYSDDVFSFYRYWGPGRKLHDDPIPEDGSKPLPYKYYFWDAPWAKFLYRKDYLKKGQWIPFSDLRFETQKKEEVLQDCYTTSFKFKDGEDEIEAEASLTGEKLYYGIHWFPKWLKPLFHEVRTQVWINFSTDIGKGRGSWKGGTVGLSYPFNKNLPTTWLDFQFNELPNYIRKRK